MAISRRALIGAGATALGASAIAAGAQAQPRPPRLRLSLFDPRATPHLRSLATAIRLMRDFDDDQRLEPFHPLSWRRQAHIHSLHWGHHGTWRFLPWHRVQLIRFEEIVRRLSGDPGFAMPFWDWREANGAFPTLFSRIDSPFYMSGREPDLASTSLVAMRRRWDDQNRANPARIFEDGFLTFVGHPQASGSIENTGHNFLHVAVGGRFGQVETATLDPIFWFHHCNVDRGWAAWQRSAAARGVRMESYWLDERFTGFIGADGLSTPPMTTRDVLDTRRLGYDYDPAYPHAVFNLRLPPPPPGATTLLPSGGEKRHLGVRAAPDSAVTELVLKRETLDWMRRREETKRVEADGRATFAREGLRASVVAVELAVTRAGGAVEVQPITTLFTFGVDHGGHGPARPASADPAHAGIAHDEAAEGASFGFALREPLLALAQNAEVESVTVRATTRPLRAADGWAAPEAISMVLDLVATDFRWA